MKSDFLDTARSLAQRAAHEVLSLLHQPIHQERKQDKSLVTAADLKSDEIIREGLREAFPSHAILTEENGISGPENAEYVWLVDPLDGTKAFAKGVAGFSVMVGLLKHGTPVLGVVIDPLEGHVYEAIQGEGAFHTLNGQKTRIEVSSRDQFPEMRLVVSTGFPEDKMLALQKTLTGPRLAPINSVGIKVGIVVRQEADIYINHHSVHYWDTCAPQVILEEAGGVFTKLDGSKLRYDLKTGFSHHALTLVSNGRRHAELAGLVSGVMRD